MGARVHRVVVVVVVVVVAVVVAAAAAVVVVVVCVCVCRGRWFGVVACVVRARAGSGAGRLRRMVVWESPHTLGGVWARPHTEDAPCVGRTVRCVGAHGVGDIVSLARAMRVCVGLGCGGITELR